MENIEEKIGLLKKRSKLPSKGLLISFLIYLICLPAAYMPDQIEKWGLEFIGYIAFVAIACIFVFLLWWLHMDSCLEKLEDERDQKIKNLKEFKKSLM